ncbi:hypothetical protein FQN60_008408 [Etheostoma spectabile]|uniref:Uncharacterized protein n=1 Tax=Etheostoma spectabile TaxID=54343 RepID=A0A5J5CV02_9PERO|nr:hypothetical protein FQN60_008408 [Etheostoma spectabile]
MDYQFPQQLFPSFYNCAPPDSVLKHCAGNWGCYDRVRPQGTSGPLSSWTFTSKHQVRGETWHHTEPVPIPLLSPKKSFLWPSTPPEPLDFTKHMENFFMDHRLDAFGCMSEILSENFNFKQGQRERYRRDSVHMWKVKNFLDMMKYKICAQSYSSRALDMYSALLSDVVPSIPPELLGSLLYEELTEQRDCMLFSEGATGGALAFVPYSQSGSDSQRGCLLYPGNRGLDCLNFHRVELQHHKGSSSCVDSSNSDPFTFQLKGPIRQISSTSLLNDCCVAVRSDYLCGVWRFSERNEPRLLQVVNTKEVATCINVSPHVLGEVLVASESGAANLWTVGRGMQKIREEDSNLYFNAKSSWRWCEFSAHPRVMLYADRTGVELTDIRQHPRVSQWGETYSVKISGRRPSLPAPHHNSAYIMDERFPCMPMLKWDHMMQSPPMFCHAVRGSTSSGSEVGGAKTTKVLLGSHSSQEITLLQYSGGRAEACSTHGPPRALLRPRDSLKHLPIQIPHRLDIATSRLSSPAAGLTCIQKRGRSEAGGEECICILQLTEAGDIFYQILEPEQPDTCRPPAADEDLLPQPTLKEATTSGREPDKQLLPHSQMVISDTSSDEGVIGPTQGPTVQRFVAETPEKEQRVLNSYFSSEDSDSGGKGQYLKQLGLQVLVNNDPELDQVCGLEVGVKDGTVGKNTADNTVEPSSLGHIGPSDCHVPVKLSDSALVTWKHWLQKLMRKSRDKKPRPRCLQHFTVKTGGLLHPSEDERGEAQRYSTKAKPVQNLRRDLRACMSKRSLLVHSAVSASLEAPDVVMVPDQVDIEVWRDQISQRLTLSWQGEEAWRAWWEDQLGLNREKKVEALKKKRRREKEAKRATGRRLELSGSFTSSISYQSELGDFSDSTGWSSATSQGAWSDTESKVSQSEGSLECRVPRASPPSTVQTDTPDYTLTTTPQSVKGKQSDQQTPSSSHILPLSQTPKPDSTLANQRSNKRPAEDYLSSLFAPQLRGSQSGPQRSLRMDLSQDTTVWSGFSQSQFLSQSSQGRMGLSQASQPKKKKSRMGF